LDLFPAHRRAGRADPDRRGYHSRRDAHLSIEREPGARSGGGPRQAGARRSAASKSRIFSLPITASRSTIAQFAIEGSAVPKPAFQPAAQDGDPGEPAAAASKLVVPTRFVAFVFDDAISTPET
jgi:hypothetical protein